MRKRCVVNACETIDDLRLAFSGYVRRKFVATIKYHHDCFGIIGFLEWCSTRDEHEQDNAQTPNI